MDRDRIHTATHNFLVTLGLVPIVIMNFVAMWCSVNSTVKKASRMFSEKLSRRGLPEETVRTFTKKYASIKDYIFEGFLKRKNRIQSSSRRQANISRRVLIKILPGGQVFLRRRDSESREIKSAILLDTTKTVILLVGIARALERDVYWVAACFISYILYSLLFGIMSELIGKYKDSSKGLLGSAVSSLQEALSDTRVIAITSLALSSHSILAAPFVPLYHVIPGLDFVEHYISGFGIGLFAVKTYRTFITHVSFNRALGILGRSELTHQISLFEKVAELPFMCYSSLFVGFAWEGFEEIAEKFTPRVVNVFLWNGVADIFMNLLGGLTAYTLVYYSFIIRKQEDGPDTDGKDEKINLQSVKTTSYEISKHIKDMINNVYSESVAERISKKVETYGLNRIVTSKRKRIH